MKNSAEILSWEYVGIWFLLHSYSLDHFSTLQQCEKSARQPWNNSIFADMDNGEKLSLWLRSKANDIVSQTVLQ